MNIFKVKKYENIEHFSKVFYTEAGGKYRPYLELVLSNQSSLLGSSSLLTSPKTLGLVDSGADHTAIPYSIGRSIGLEPVMEGERLMEVGGVGGVINCVERRCSIYLSNQLKQEVYEFNETVWWKVPSKEIESNLNTLINELTEALEVQNQALVGTPLHKHIQGQINGIRMKIISINSNLEGGILVGRPFFDNFEFIQFKHDDRKHEDKCFFNYKVKKSKLIKVHPLIAPSGELPEQFNRMGTIVSSVSK